MTITINGVAISDEAITAEALHHADADSPRAAAACALAVRELLLQRVKAAGIAPAELTDDVTSDSAIERLLEREAPVPQPTTEECRQFYERHRERFMSGELVEASHILFAVTPNAPVEAIRRQAEAILRQLAHDASRFAELARQFSNCPSSAQGGNLGQLQRGDTVPEFERAIFGAQPGLMPSLVNTRYGFHIVRIDRQIAGHAIPFEAVRDSIARALIERVRSKAAEQYVRILASRAQITGLDLGAASSALVQ